MPSEMSPLLCVCCLLLATRGSAFNLETTNTIAKEGETGSLFGFSVALHKQTNPNVQSWILVGAPQARAQSQQLANRTGGLFACPIITEDDECDQVEIDNDVDLKRESKENQWLGVTVKSQGIGGKVVTCAHRYELRQRVNQSAETRDMIGRCYVLSQDLQIRDELDGGDWKFCEGRTQGHQRFGYCQQGIAAGFTPDENYILFGAPGTYNWKGNVRTEQLSHSLVHLGIYDDGPYEAGDERKQDANLIPVPANSYLGFSVDSAKGLTQQDELSVVSGAPRANHTGAVVILKKEGVNRLAPEHILWGEELGSSYGYAVATVDLNNDGWVDLVVGAPYFFDRKEEIGGAVYVYINQAGKWGGVRSLRLNGTKDSLFGLAVANIGDINQDGFEDIAVGAPYDGNGKVYIYHGNIFGLNVIPAQIIEGETVGVTKFGYSIAGGLDVDDNFYPDMVVGSLSDSAVLFRACPVINVTKQVYIKPQPIDLELNNCKHEPGICIDVRACFLYRSKPGSYNPRIVLGFVLDADSVEVDGQRKRPPRVSFQKRKPTDPENQYSGEVVLRRQTESSCINVTMKLQENLRDKLRPIPVTLTYLIKEVKRKRKQVERQLTHLMPVLNAQDSNVHREEVNFLREGCGPDKICQSNLQMKYNFCSRLDEDIFQPLPKDEQGQQVFYLSDQKDIALEITVTNQPSDMANPMKDGDDAHEAVLIANFPDSLFYSAFRTSPKQDSSLFCAANANGSQAECELGNPMKRNAQVTFYLILSTSRIAIETTTLPIVLQLSTISEQTGLDPVTATAHVILVLPVSLVPNVEPQNVFFGGDVMGESAMRKEEDLGSRVDYKLTVLNTGKVLRTLSSAFLNIQWPYEIGNGKWLLYPMKIEFEGDENTECSPAFAINPLKLPRDGDNPVLWSPERLQNGGQRQSLLHHAESKKTLTLDCELGTARCVAFQCPLRILNTTTRMSIFARLWNSTFLEEYASYSSIELTIRANISVKSSIRNLKVKEAAAEFTIQIYPEKTSVGYVGAPWLIILIAVLAGILVLALLVLLLWKCGFFKRSRYNDTVPQYHAVRIGKEQRQLHMDEKKTRYQKEWMTHWIDSDGYS
ncbi:integrin alpha-7-like isoform X1 [Hemiscyllium ocellatum]|uniref:integrin alpha-7-like isoform X1 n=1 Tax=Hemiscyllium ocellatum TaxID=170820 RepID=UPI0029661E4D|nr:integrin alpha-7-like isoform X1 [Hemiscyllium ocellatum]